MSSIDLKAIAKELAIIVAVVVAADLGAALIGFSENPGAVLDNPTAWAIGIGRALLPKLALALRAKLGEIVGRLFGGAAA